MKWPFSLIAILSILIVASCGKDPEGQVVSEYKLIKPSHFPNFSIPSDNPLTAEKIRLGRMLFYDKALSEDNQIACSNCHKQEFAFGSDRKLDEKVHHGMTTRNSSVLFNLVFTPKFFWDGRTSTLEATVLDAMEGEQKFKTSFIISKLFPKSNYKALFKSVFNTETPSDTMVAKAMASFIRTMISGNSLMDKGAKEGDPNRYLSADAKDGKILYETEAGDCFHCHGDAKGNPLMTDNLFHNNGLDSHTSAASFIDLGFGKVTMNQSDNGTFRTPALRNLSYSAPFMHDGRISDLGMVLGHYNQGLRRSATVDPNISKHISSGSNVGGMNLSPLEISRLKAYLLSLDDPEFIADTQFSNPFK